MDSHGRVCAYIDLDAIAHNFAVLCANTRVPASVVAVVKANAYGHGAVRVARRLEEKERLWGFAVATAAEALELFAAGIRKPILILGYVFWEDLPKLVRCGIRLTVFEMESARAIAQEAARQRRTARVHIAVDTGMSRIGVSDDGVGLGVALGVASLPNVFVEGLFTHFARADEAEKEASQRQLARFLAFAGNLLEKGVRVPLCHCANSAGILDLPQSHLDAVRAGIALYGIYPSGEVQRSHARLRPAMEIKSHLSFVKEVGPGVPISYGGTFVTTRPTRVATVPVGYADGYPRSLSNRGSVIVCQRRAPIIGRVCMDQFMVDVTDIPEARAGAEVTLLGRDGDLRMDAEEIGAKSGRFPYELVCMVAGRVPRVYMESKRGE